MIVGLIWTLSSVYTVGSYVVSDNVEAKQLPANIHTDLIPTYEWPIKGDQHIGMCLLMSYGHFHTKKMFQKAKYGAPCAPNEVY